MLVRQRPAVFRPSFAAALAGFSRKAACRACAAWLILPCLLLFLSGCASRQAPVSAAPSPYTEGQLVLPDGTVASERDLLRLADAADYILVGERHDNPLDHAVQAALLASLEQAGKKPLLGLEMLPRDIHDRTLRAFSQGRLHLEELPASLDWRRTWGFDFALYRPVFSVARRYSIPIYGLNISNDIRRRVSGNGLEGLTAAEKKDLPRRIIPPLPEQREKLAAFFRIHGAIIVQHRAAEAASGRQITAGTAFPGRSSGGAPQAEESGAFERFVLIQSLWDSTMAEQAAKIRQKTAAGRSVARPLVILAGGGHVEYGYGIAHRLKELEPASRSLLVMPFSGNRPEPGAADLFYYSSMPASWPAVSAGRGSRLGLTLTPVNGKLRITKVEPDSRALRAGLKPGDILLRAGSVTVHAAVDLHTAAMEAKQQARPMTVAVWRQEEIFALYIPDSPEGAEAASGD